MKDCKRCNQVKPFSEFNPNKHIKSGYDSYCRPCRKEYATQYYEKKYTRKFPKEKIKDGKRYCTKCEAYKDLSEFTEHMKSWCQTCKSEDSRKKYDSRRVNPRKYVDGKMHCRKCDQYLDPSNFTKRKSNTAYCNSCVTILQHKKTLKKHNMTYERYLEVYEAQNHGCKICGRDESSFRTRLSVDHDHNCCPGEASCGKCIRGLLCHHCNAALGNVQDDVDRLQKMIDYLNESKNAL